MSVRLYKRGATWWFSLTIAGRRIRRSTGTSEKGLAREIASKAEADEHRRRLYGSEAVATMAQAILAYLDSGKPHRFIAPIADHWKDTRLAEIRPEAVRQSARKLYPGLSNATWNRQVIAPTQAVINHAAGLGWCGAMRVKRFPVDPKVKLPANIEWVRAFARQADADEMPHLAALALFMFATGARVGQACDLVWGNVSLSEGKAALFTAKPTPWTRIAHLPPELVASMASLSRDRRADAPVFGYAGRDSLTGQWRNVVARAGIAYLSPHSCRHGFATEMLRAGFDVKTVAKHGGWRDASVVLRTYAHALDDPTITDTLFGTNPAQRSAKIAVTNGNKRVKLRDT